MGPRVHLGPAPAEGELVGYRHGDHYLLVVRRGGRLSSIDDWCNHAGCLLSEGRMDGDSVICPCHDTRFRLADGAVLSEPRLCEDQAVYEVEEEDGQIYWRKPW